MVYFFKTIKRNGVIQALKNLNCTLESLDIQTGGE